MLFCDHPVAANVSLLFSELPYADRFGAAAAAGFDRVETWWPFATPVPHDSDVDAFVAAIEHAGVQLTGLNFWAGDMPAGDRGVAAIPARAGELAANLPVVVDIARRTGCRAFNLLYGRLGDDVAAGHETAARSLAAAADAVDAVDGIVLVEPLAAAPNGTYPLHTVDDALAVIDGRLGGRTDVKVLFDLFHLGSNGVDIVADAHRHVDRIGHVQFADSPGRGEPGSGELPIREALIALRDAGYAGGIAAEYAPGRATGETLGWADR
jgi:Hydroxypyruvate isomerase